MKEKDLNFEDKLWKAIDKLRKKIEIFEYKYVGFKQNYDRNTKYRI